MATEPLRADTFPQLLIRNARLYAGRPAYRHKDLGIWQVWTWAQVLEEVRAFSVGLQELGLHGPQALALRTHLVGKIRGDHVSPRDGL